MVRHKAPNLYLRRRPPHNPAPPRGAGQSKRATLARVRRLGALVGLHPTGRPDKLRVGRLVGLTPVHLVLEEVLIGPPGGAALLHGPGVRNAKRLGRGQRPP